ncbi:RxLR effector protein [Phytophthora megakarya]|uniref:RxLR effector protein n=1 Tax=Phytophthora megakarya TaxID=4795 RepID=A0A225VAH5_9STRA|nr:RxLR effector protein [Phytophthora megakarya]
MLNEAKKNPDTKDVAVKLYAAKLRGWLDEKKTPDNIFAQLGLKTALSSVLTKPLFITYVDYVKLFNRENPGNKVWLLHPLLGSHSENYLIQLVDEAMKFPNTEKAIKIVQVELFQNWLRQKTSPNYVFAHFVFKNVMEGDNFLTNQNLKLWTKYLHDFNQRYPDRKTNMLDALRLSYSDEELAKALAQAINVPETKKLTSNLQLSLLNTWVRELKSPDEVSTILNLGSSNPLMKSYVEKFNWALAQISEKYFDDPRMWLKYVDYFRAKDPASEKSEIMILTDRYGDDIVAKMIAVTTTRRTLEYKQETFQKEHLQALKTAQVKGWYSSGKTPEDVFKLLHLDEAGNNLFDSPVLETWLNFAKKAVKYDRNLKKLEFDILNRSYGDERLSKILIAGKDTQFSSEANSLQKLQITAWLKSKKDVNDVYKWLMVKGTAKSNPERAVYKNYVERYSKEYLGGDTI